VQIADFLIGRRPLHIELECPVYHRWGVYVLGEFALAVARTWKAELRSVVASVLDRIARRKCPGCLGLVAHLPDSDLKACSARRRMLHHYGDELWFAGSVVAHSNSKRSTRIAIGCVASDASLAVMIGGCAGKSDAGRDSLGNENQRKQHWQEWEQYAVHLPMRSSATKKVTRRCQPGSVR